MIRDRLKILMQDKNIRVKELSKAVSIPPPTLYGLLSGEAADPRISSLLPLAKYFKVSIEQLTGDVPLDSSQTSGHSIAIPRLKANEVEVWLDGKLPAGLLFYVANNENIPVSERCFILRSNSNAMTPLFQLEDELIINPEITLENNDIALFKLASGQGDLLLRKVALEGEDKFLIPFNSNFPMITLDNKDSCLGVVVANIAYTYKKL